MRLCLFIGLVFAGLYISAKPVLACSADQYGNCTGTCPAGYRCEQYGYGICNCDLIVYPTLTPTKTPTSTPKPQQCEYRCTGQYLPDCVEKTGDPGSFAVCNYDACPISWACTVDTTDCDVWSNWVCTNDGITETRYCISPQRSQDQAQARQPCSGTTPTPTPNPGSPPTCAAWGSININNCTQAGWQSTPKSPNCITGVQSVTLYLSSSGATRMGFYNAPTTDTNCTTIADGSFFGPQAYATSRAWNLSTGYGNKKVCARFINANGDAKCGALIQYAAPTPTPTFTPTPTSAPVAWVRLKDTSFVSVNSLSNDIPQTPMAYDGDDPNTGPYFMVGESGLVGAPDGECLSVQPVTNHAKILS